MDLDYINDQLDQFIINFKRVNQSIIDLLISEEINNDVNDKINLLQTVRLELLESLYNLNVMKNDIVDNINENIITAGSFVLVPRLYDKILCNDFGIVLYCDVNIVDIYWLRPQSSYELISEGIRYSISLISYDIRHYMKNQFEFVDNLAISSYVLCRPSTYGIWEKGYVLNVYKGHDNISYADIELVNSNQKICLIKSIFTIAPLPNRSSDDSTIKISQSSDITNKISSSDLSDNDIGIEFNYCKRTYSDNFIDIWEHRDKTVYKSSSNLLIDLANFGTWEKFTKGVGSKLLRNMGYIRGSGLGKNKQGRLLPIETLKYVLPPGLSLDFIKEIGNKDNKNQIKSENNKSKSSYELKSTNTVFDFLNCINVSNSATTASTVSIFKPLGKSIQDNDNKDINLNKKSRLSNTFKDVKSIF